MLKRTQHTLGFITAKKKQLLTELFIEYQRVVNEFITIYWHVDTLPKKASAAQWRQVTTWLCGKTAKCAYKQATQMIRAAQARNKKHIYAAYRKAYSYAVLKNKQWPLSTQRWAVWSKGKKFRTRVRIPCFNGDSIDLNSDPVTIYTTPKTMTHFDMAVRLGSIFGNGVSLVLPTKKHAQFNEHIAEGYVVKSSAQLRRIGGAFYINLFLEKEAPMVKAEGKTVGIDVGIKKLMSTSEGEFLGKDIESKIKKLKRRTRDSHNYKQTLSEIKDYIGQQVNKLSLDGTSCIVVEDLNIPDMVRKNGRSNKELRKTLNNWNTRLLFGRLQSRCEENRVFFTSVEPAYTSQECSSCGIICKESRKGERYECKHCGASLDADYNAALNIRNRFLGRELAVPCEQQSAATLLGFG